MALHAEADGVPERRIDLVGATRRHHPQLDVQRTGEVRRGGDLRLRGRRVGIDEQGDDLRFRYELVHQLEPLGDEDVEKEAHAGRVAFGPGEAPHDAEANRIPADREDDGDRHRGPARREDRARATDGDQQRWLLTDEVGGEFIEPIEAAFPPIDSG